MAKGGSALSGRFWNQVSDDIYEGYTQLVDQLVEDFLADGFPPFATPLGDRERMARLQALRLSQSQYYWGSSQAQAELARLEARYGGGA